MSEGAFDALRAGLADAAKTLRALTENGDADRLDLLNAVMGLDDAMGDAAELLATLPAFLAAAEPVEPIRSDLADWASRQAEAARRVAHARALLDARLADERQLDGLAAEHAELTRRLADLERAERLAASLPALREQHRVLAERVSAFSDPALRAEQAVELAAVQLDLLTGLRAGGWRAELADALAAAAAAQARLAEQLAVDRERLSGLEGENDRTRAELAVIDERAARLEDEHRELQARLSARLKANQRVAGSMAGLREADRRLTEIDGMLAAALRERETALADSRRRRRNGEAT
ncbi:hypothetical protein [Frankia sp. AvcI1]|uniref:hypothetical protein n=1 Tax=Frankia sp. AvcI1 TaxID=573496 RepID=UPI0006EC157D|nr:hypothetical protein [Frankia sp. AvcI1]